MTKARTQASRPLQTGLRLKGFAGAHHRTRVVHPLVGSGGGALVVGADGSSSASAPHNAIMVYEITDGTDPRVKARKLLEDAGAGRC